MGGWTMTSARSASLNGGLGLWERSPQRGPGIEPLMWGQGWIPPEAERFLSIFIQKSGQKLRIKNLPRVWGRLLCAAMTSPHFWSMVGGARSAYSWIRHCLSTTLQLYIVRWPDWWAIASPGNLPHCHSIVLFHSVTALANKVLFLFLFLSTVYIDAWILSK